MHRTLSTLVVLLSLFSQSPAKGDLPLKRGSAEGMIYDWEKKSFSLGEKGQTPKISFSASKSSDKKPNCKDGRTPRKTESWEQVTILSLVGPYLSIEKASEWDSEGAAHPGHVTEWKTIDARNPKKEVSLDEIFDAKAILKALLNDRVVKAGLESAGYASDEKSIRRLVKSLGDLVSRLTTEVNAAQLSDDGPDFKFPDDFLKRFSIYDQIGDKTQIRIGLPHGSEVSRGALTQIGITLPTPQKLKTALYKGQIPKRRISHDGYQVSRKAVGNHNGKDLVRLRITYKNKKPEPLRAPVFLFPSLGSFPL